MQEEFGGDAVDLYDDVIASAPGSGVNNTSGPPGGPPASNETSSNHLPNNVSAGPGARRHQHQIYVGNLTWVSLFCVTFSVRI